jgi:hypothetical protein
LQSKKSKGAEGKHTNAEKLKAQAMKIRRLYIQFAMSMLLVPDAEITRTCLNIKGFVSAIFKVYSRHTIIISHIVLHFKCLFYVRM